MANLKYYDTATSEWKTLVVGAKGEQGDVGPANTLEVGTVTDSAPGSTPEVTITGTAPDQTINFVLPTGDTGPQGDPGATGEAGPAGDTGPAGPGVSSGGLEGQILAKLTDDDYDTTWIDNYAGELRIIVKNDSGVTINKGEAVMAVDAVGDRIRVAKAVADGSVSARYMLGVAAEAIANGAEGYISLLGEIRNLNTSAYTIGTVLFIDPDVAGGLTDDEPESPALDMNIAIVTRSHASTGIIFVRMWSQGVNLGEVNDVAITDPADNQILAYDETAELWKNINIPESAAVISSATAPENTTAIWFNTENGNTYIYYDSFWTSIAGNSGAPIISDTAPTSPVLGTQWFNSSTGKSYLYYSDAWIEIDSNGATPSSGNAIINGGLDFWQRGTTFTNPTGGQYTADRIRVGFFGTGTPTASTYSRQTFTPGAAPLAGVEGEFFIRGAITTKGSNTKAGITYGVEGVRTLAGESATFSFYAKADSARQGTALIDQVFGSGGSTTVSVLDTTFSLTSSWQRFSFTVHMPSLSGKTIGTSDSVSLSIGHDTADGSSLDVWGLQLEAGPTANVFRRNANSLQGELAACQRYYQKSYNSAVNLGSGSTASLIVAVQGNIANDLYYHRESFLVTMRAAPTMRFWSFNGTITRAADAGGTDYGANSAVAGAVSDNGFSIRNLSGATLTTGLGLIITNYDASAEL